MIFNAFNNRITDNDNESVGRFSVLGRRLTKQTIFVGKARLLFHVQKNRCFYWSSRLNLVYITDRTCNDYWTNHTACIVFSLPSEEAQLAHRWTKRPPVPVSTTKKK